MRLALFILLLPLAAFGQAFVKYDTNLFFLTSSNIFDSNIVSTAAIAKTKGANGQLSLSISNASITDAMLASTFKKLDAGETNLNTWANSTTTIPLTANGFAASVTNYFQAKHPGGAIVGRIDTNGYFLTGSDVIFTNTTTDATITTLGTLSLPNDTVFRLDVQVIGYATGFTNAAGYWRHATLSTTGGVCRLVGTVLAMHTTEDIAGWDATIDASGADARVRVTGASGTTVKWSAVTRVHRQLW